MNICLVSTGHDARDDRLYFKQAKSLAKEHQVTLIAPSRAGSSRPQDDDVTFVRLDIKPGKVSRLLRAAWLALTLPRAHYDVIHLSDIETMPFALLFRWRCKAKIALDIWEANYERILGPRKRPSIIRRALAHAVRTAERIVAARCDLVMTADIAIAESLGPSIKPLVVFNYPLLSVLTCDKLEIDQMEKRYKGRTCLIYHGSMAEERGVLSAIEAMRYVRRAFPEAKLLLVGTFANELLRRVNSLVELHDLRDDVDLVGWVDHSQIGKYLAVSKVGLVPFARTRKFEKNIPQKIFEYWAMALPVVATDLSPIAPYVERCQGGILIKTNDAQTLAGAVCKLMDRPDRARQMGLRGRFMVQSEWRWERVEGSFLAAFRALEKTLDG